MDAPPCGSGYNFSPTQVEIARPSVVVAGRPDALALVPIVALACGWTRSASVDVGQRWSASDGLDTAWDGLTTA